jgi:hypothetical protein
VAACPQRQNAAASTSEPGWLNSLVGQRQRSNASKIRSARAEFARQLDGTHRQQDEADWTALPIQPSARWSQWPKQASGTGSN